MTCPKCTAPMQFYSYPTDHESCWMCGKLVYPKWTVPLGAKVEAGTTPHAKKQAQHPKELWLPQLQELMKQGKSIVDIHKKKMLPVPVSLRRIYDGAREIRPGKGGRG